ncbi:MAG: helix-turn-helix domain-containing protein [Chloroflexi bacterium]|nr:helix-turn-helix domain-containing protein [Chloroflexota bacterium]
MTAKREFFSTNEVAQILGISPFTIRRYIQLRKLKAVKLEGSYRVRRADLDTFIHAREIETEEELAELDEPELAVTPLRRKPVATVEPATRPAPRAKRVAHPEPTTRRAARPITPAPKARAKRGKEEKE